MLLSIRFENFESHRYYLLHLTRDLFGEWVLIKSWGGINKAGGRIISLPCGSYESALSRINEIRRKREQRGYQVVSHIEEEISEAF